MKISNMDIQQINNKISKLKEEINKLEIQRTDLGKTIINDILKEFEVSGSLIIDSDPQSYRVYHYFCLENNLNNTITYVLPIHKITQENYEMKMYDMNWAADISKNQLKNLILKNIYITDEDEEDLFLFKKSIKYPEINNPKDLVVKIFELLPEFNLGSFEKQTVFNSKIPKNKMNKKF